MEKPTPAILVEQCLNNVWNERDISARTRWLHRIYHKDAKLFEPGRDEAIVGPENIAATVAGVMGGFPPDFRFVVQGSASGHHGIGLANWQGESNGKVLVTGFDVIKVHDDLIIEQYIFINPAP